jgi:hypothetical protein
LKASRKRRDIDAGSRKLRQNGFGVATIRQLAALDPAHATIAGALRRSLASVSGAMP